jgi:primosomal protein N' (replication factor Y) (superfamily II helicase)
VGAHRRGRGAPQGGGSARIAETRVCRVQPDLPAVARAFDYLVPEELAGIVQVGTIVRVPLHGRRVRGWVVADGVEPEARRSELRRLAKVVSAGPPAEVVELCRWAAWRYAGPFPLLLRSASPPNVVPPSGDPELHTAVFPRREAPDGMDAAGVDALVTRDRGLLAWPPSAEWPDVVGVLVANEESTIVVAPDSRRVRALVDDLRRRGRDVIVVRGNEPDALRTKSWNRARAGATVVVGGRVAVLAPVPDLAAVLVLDDGDETLKEERAPTWNARDLALERARRSGGRCTLVSPAPTLEAEATAGPPARPTRPFERDAWPRFDVVDLRDEPPERGLFSDALTTALHATVDRGARAVCVVNRKGRAQLLVCRQCGHVAQCEVCDAAVAETEGGLVCRRCGTERPRVCLHCHSTQFARRRPGVTRVREEMAALLPRVTVAEVDAATAALPSAGVLVGTEAVLHRADVAPGGIELVAFLEFDQELLATRYRAAEQALWLLVRAARVVGGKRGDGRVLVQTRVPDHDVIEAALAADPTIVADAERARRRILGFPPFGGLAEVNGTPGAVDVACVALRAVRALRVLGPVAAGTSSRALVQAESADVLCDALAEVDLTPAREHGRLRIDVDPLRV